MSAVASAKRTRIIEVPEPALLERFNGYSANQLRQVLETITYAALALRDHLDYSRMRAESQGSTPLLITTDLQMAQHAAERIGSLADELLGWETLESAAEWFTGVGMVPTKGAA